MFQVRKGTVQDFEPLHVPKVVELNCLKVNWSCFKLQDYKLKFELELEHQFSKFKEVDVKVREAKELTNGRTIAAICTILGIKFEILLPNLQYEVCVAWPSPITH